uniref:Photochlorophyllide reductase subunit B n=1 Tax=Medinilla magnifica TaxID=1799599 RepID=A0A7D4Z8S3_9MYRT|nr:photochlorophyllide reductase subunit B [Medinilla magnifica]QKS31797.1 photochlorophyllide reductase subunit B [Medinilla magnifica]
MIYDGTNSFFLFYYNSFVFQNEKWK